MKRLMLLLSFVTTPLFLPRVAWADPVAYVVTSASGSGSGGQFGTMDLTTGTFTAIGPGDPAGFDGILAEPGGFLSVNGNNELVRLNAQTGAETTIGNTGISVSVFGGMAGGSGYAVDYSNNLYQVNLNIGLATLIGAMGLPGQPRLPMPSAIRWSAPGRTLYYTYETANPANPVASTLYTLNLSTGAATPVGLTGASVIVGSGIIDNKLYGFTGFNSQEIVTIDPSTGASTAGASTPVIVFGAAQAVPEPASVIMLGVVRLFLCVSPIDTALDGRDVTKAILFSERLVLQEGSSQRCQILCQRAVLKYESLMVSSAGVASYPVNEGAYPCQSLSRKV